METCQFAFLIRTLRDREPISIQEALSQNPCKEAMQAEINAIKGTVPGGLFLDPTIDWLLVFNGSLRPNKLPKDPDKCKARHVAKGYALGLGIVYEDTFAPTSRMATI